MTIDTSTTTLDRTEEATTALADRVFASLLGALDVLTIIHPNLILLIRLVVFSELPVYSPT
jgi:hypothetical protein